MFWSNHFCVSANKGPVRGIAGAYEREAIRPHVLGTLCRHAARGREAPGDARLSGQPGVRRPQQQGGSANAAWASTRISAREILELHTLGVDGGYAQEDVTNLARILTGWTVGGLDQKQVEPGRFMFAVNRHEPGNWKVLAKALPIRQRASGPLVSHRSRAPSSDLEAHRSKARAHFVGDAAPPSLVAKLDRAFRDTGGDLGAVSRALVKAPEAWETGPRKSCRPTTSPSRSPAPSHFRRRPLSCCGSPTCSASRCGIRPRQPDGPTTTMRGWHPRPCARGCASPKASRAWSSARRSAGHCGRPPRSRSERQTRQTIARAETREQGFELLIMSPEFLRR